MFIMQVNECVQGIFSLCYSFHLSIYLLILATKFARPGPMKWKHWVLTTVVAQLVKNLPVMQETWVWSLGWEDHLEEMQPTPVLLPGEFHGQRSQAGYSPWDRKESDMTVQLTFNFHFQQLDYQGIPILLLNCYKFFEGGDIKHSKENCYLCFSFPLMQRQYMYLNMAERDGNTRPPDLPLEKPIGRSGSNS